MRLEVDLSDGGGGVPAPDLPSVQSKPRRRGLDRFECSVLGAFAAVSVFVLALDLWRVIFHGAVWTGTDGVYIVDQLQYLAWIRDASHHFLVSNLFVLRDTPADYFQPAVVISGGLTALGVPVSLSLLLWKPVAVVTFFFAVRAYAQRSVTGTWPRRTVLVLALFFGSFTLVYGTWSVLGDLFPGFLSWGYTFGLMALALMVWALVAVLAVEGLQLLGWRRLRHPLLIGAAAVALFTIPATVKELSIAHSLAAPTAGNANFITRDERSALNYLLHNKDKGSVMTGSYLGAAVPGKTGRRTYVGDCLWSEPQCLGLTGNAWNLFQGWLTPAAARSFVLDSGARFVLADCTTKADLPRLLGPIIRNAQGFGCAAVYEVE
jgi:hypothetical protein